MQELKREHGDTPTMFSVLTPWQHKNPFHKSYDESKSEVPVTCLSSKNRLLPQPSDPLKTMLAPALQDIKGLKKLKKCEGFMAKINVDEIFSYHAPTKEQLPKYENIRSAAKEFAHVLIANTPESADQSVAIRLLRESVMTANASITLEGF